MLGYLVSTFDGDNNFERFVEDSRQTFRDMRSACVTMGAADPSARRPSAGVSRAGESTTWRWMLTGHLFQTRVVDRINLRKSDADFDDDLLFDAMEMLIADEGDRRDRRDRRDR